jgi:hypothetical protein
MLHIFFFGKSFIIEKIFGSHLIANEVSNLHNDSNVFYDIFCEFSMYGLKEKCSLFLRNGILSIQIDNEVITVRNDNFCLCYGYEIIKNNKALYDNFDNFHVFYFKDHKNLSSFVENYGYRNMSKSIIYGGSSHHINDKLKYLCSDKFEFILLLNSFSNGEDFN